MERDWNVFSMLERLEFTAASALCIKIAAETSKRIFGTKYLVLGLDRFEFCILHLKFFVDPNIYDSSCQISLANVLITV